MMCTKLRRVQIQFIARVPDDWLASALHTYHSYAPVKVFIKKIEIELLRILEANPKASNFCAGSGLNCV